MLCQPCFSDRKVHARYVNQVWRVGFQLEDKLEKGEIERAIKKLMADDDGKEMSVMAMELKEEVDVCTRKDCIGSAFNVKGIMECPNCREIENGKWRYYVSCSPDHELDLSEDEMDYEDSPIEFLDMVKVQSLSRMIIMDENGKQIDHRRGQCLEGGSDNPKSSTCSPGRADEYYCTGLTDVRPQLAPNLAPPSTSQPLRPADTQ
ncbi:hypothetical protein ACFX13_014803 [Malus domestica]